LSASNQPLSFNVPAYPLDKIFFTAPEGASVAVPQNGSPSFTPGTTVTLPHTNGSTFFIDVQSSPDNTNWYDAGYEPYYYDGGAMLYYPKWVCWWQVSSTNVLIKFGANDAAYTMYYRVIGYYKV